MGNVQVNAENSTRLFKLCGHRHVNVSESPSFVCKRGIFEVGGGHSQAAWHLWLFSLAGEAVLLEGSACAPGTGVTLNHQMRAERREKRAG